MRLLLPSCGLELFSKPNRPRPGRVLLELDGPILIVPAEIAIYYDGQEEATVVDGTTEIGSDGSTTITVDVGDLPRPGNPIQIVIQPFPESDPILISGQVGSVDKDGNVAIEVQIHSID
jgi:hypothetical protein